MLALAGVFLFFACAQSANAATPVYYSVGQSTADLQTGTSTVTISSTTGLATFSAAQTGNIGVGDRVTVATNTVYYISGKASSTGWYVVTATGTMPEATSSAPVTSIKREYTSLAAAVAGASDANHAATSSLVGGDLVLNLPCYYDSGPDTSAVNVTGYTTGTSTYIKIYTPASTSIEANFSQRHQGRWDDVRYNLYISGGTYCISSNVHDAIIEGVQCKINLTTNQYHYGITKTMSDSGSYFVISNSIITASSDNSAHDYEGNGIGFNAYGSYYIYNNIIYNWNLSTQIDSCIQDVAEGTESYFYNNTIFGCDIGISAGSSLDVAKNNVVQNGVTGYSGIFHASSTNNLSFDGTAPGSNSMASSTVQFADLANKDFHLAASSTARNRGADLSNDPYFAFSTDIDGHARSTTSPVSRAWDIGADEGATAIYYSVGQNTSDHKTGTPTVTVSSTTGLATFDVAQTASNMGVGDVITYGSDKCYITAKASTTAWYCVTATGTMPVATTSAPVASIAHAFSSLFNAEANSSNSTYLNTADLAANNYQLNWACYYDSGPDTTHVQVQGYKTTANNYLEIYTPSNESIEVNLSQRHQGIWDDNKYNLSVASVDGYDRAINPISENIRIEGLQVSVNNNGQIGAEGIQIENNSSADPDAAYEAYVVGNIIRGIATAPFGSEPPNGIRIQYWNLGSIASKYHISNNIIYGFYDGATDSSGILVVGKGSVNIANNTVHNSSNGVTRLYNGSSTVLANNIVSSSTVGYSGIFSASSTSNISDHADAPGQNQLNSTVVQFSDSLNEDFHLAASSTARNSGADLSADANYAFNADIDGHSRGNQGAWDIGADEGASHIYYSVGQNTSDHKTGSPNVTVSSTTGLATFDVAQTAVNMGVGDVITYNTTEKCYITAKASTTAWYCQTATGTAPVAATGATVDSITHAFSSLSAAISGASGGSYLNTADLASTNKILNLPCYNDGSADTAAVTLAGYTTALNNYIKIYTPNNAASEANASQRHSGKAGTGYRLRANAKLYISLPDIKFDGIELYSDTGADQGLRIDPSGSVTFNVSISNSILHNFVDVFLQSHILTNVNFWNNYVYDFSSTGYYNLNSTLLGNIYNNTFYSDNGFRAIRYATGTLNMANNLVNGNFNMQYNVWTSTYSSSNNISSDASSPNTAFRNKNVAFASAANKDFHLASADTSARDSGVSLASDSYKAFASDIDGHTRPNNLAWDIGADEGASAVYYSVGQSTADLQTGTSTVTISSTTGLATFSTAQTGNIGVGDRVTVATNTVYYISGKASTSAWYVVTATGTLPQATTSAPVTSIKREFTSMSSAVASASNSSHLNTADLYISNMQLNIPAYYDSGADTAPVAIGGYSTALPNYIKLYTPNNTANEANSSQRHQGKWADTSYRLEVSTNAAIIIFDKNTMIDGLQIYGIDNTGITTQSIGENNAQMHIKNNIIKHSGNAANKYGIILNYEASMGFGFGYVANNIVYDFNVSNGQGISSGSGGWYGYFYNNTVINSNYCFTNGGGTVIVKNNIAQNCVDGYRLIVSASSTNNISDLASDAPGTNPKDSTVVSFADAANGDYHLAASSSARNVGADLSADTNFAFSSDIDGHTRSGAWDIGADEGATAVYYSVGQNTSDHKTGSPVVTISSSTGLATFDVAQTAANMGVGDVITYGSDKCYITSKASTTAWYCQTATGTMPVATTSATVASIAHAYASLSAAEAGAPDSAHLNASDLALSNYQLNFPCYYDTGVDSAAVAILGWETGASNYIRVYTPTSETSEVNSSQRASGAWENGKYALSTASGIALFNMERDVIIDGLQLSSPDNNVVRNIVDNANVYFSNNIVKGSATSYVGGFGVDSGSNGKYVLTNNILYGFTGTESRGIIFQPSSSSTNMYAYNNTVSSSTHGIRYATGRVYLKNNLVQGSSDGYINWTGTGIVDSSSDNNISDIAGDAPNATFSTSSISVQFADALNKDFHLAASSTARNRGVDLGSGANYAFSTDIDGHARGNQGAWDIGADEGATAIYYSVGQNTSDHKTGSPNVTVSSTTGLATFDVAQTAVNMGVGDVITYNTTEKCYITAKASTTAWYCQTATGTAPVAATGATVNSIAHAFSSLNAGVTGASGASYLNASNLASSNYQLNFPCYYDSGSDTAVVTVQNYTTAASNHIKIYTPYNTTNEVNQSQRHQGKWDDSKYALSVTSAGASAFSALVIKVPNLNIEGLQIFNNKSAAGNVYAIDLSTISTFNVRLASSIFRGPDTHASDDYMGSVATLSGVNSHLKILNNISYNWGKISSRQNCYATFTTDTVAYNNLAYNCYDGFAAGSTNHLFYAKNNIAQNCIDGFSGGANFNAASDYNISDLAGDNTGGVNDKVSTVVSFADAANKDYHLAASSTARNAGANLSSDQYHAFNTDIDGQVRRSSSWSVGADEPANAVYYSVGQSTADLQTGTSTVTISSTTGLATFSTAQTGNIGVGDRLTVATNTVYYISSKASTSAWYVVTATGTLPQATTSAPVTSIKREYTSMAAAVSGAVDASHLSTADLATANVQLNIPAYYDSGADTATVNVIGYKTGVPNFIKLYTPRNTVTEANFSQRHRGKTGGSNFSIKPATGRAVAIGSKNVRVDGLEIDMAISNTFAIVLNYSSTDVFDSYVSNNLISNVAGDWAGLIECGDGAAGSKVHIYNNILSNVPGGSERRAIRISGATLTAYVYNNTFYNVGRALWSNGATIIAKNNTAQICTEYCYFDLNASSTNNISSDATSPDVDLLNVNVAFADVLNKDFHLAASSTARNRGADLSADANFAFSTDIDGHGRSGLWDIGADEGATAVYYSVGQNTSDHKTGSPVVTISSSTGLATFDVAQTASNMGVGDVITYGSDKCYITAKASTTAWYCATATGTMPVATTSATVTSITHSFNSLNAALPAGAGGAKGAGFLNASDLVTGNYQLNVPCYYDSGPDIASVAIDGWTTSPSNYLKVYTPSDTVNEVNYNQRHQGQWDDTKYRLVHTSAGDYQTTLSVLASFVTIDGMQLHRIASSGINEHIIGANPRSVYGRTNDIRVTNNIIRGEYSGANNATAVYYANGSGIADASGVVANNIIYDIKSGTSTGYKTIRLQTQDRVSVYSNTIVNCGTGVETYYNNYGVLKNNAVQGCADGFNGTFNSLSDYNISDIVGDAPNATFSTSSIVVQFADSANKDFHLAASSSARNAGVNLSGDANFAFASDIDAHARPAGSWDIGSDEGATPIYYSVGQNTSDHKTGSPTVTISSTTGLATFSVAQTATNMGVGDVITYGTTNKCYITSKASTTAWYCQSATGTPPVAATDATVNSIAHAFSSLSAAESGAVGASYLNTSNLTGNNYQLNIPCYYDSGPDTAGVIIDGWTASPNNHIRVYTPASTTAEANASQRHQGKWDDLKYRLEYTTNTTWQRQLFIVNFYTKIDGLQVKLTYGHGNSFAIDGAAMEVSNNIVQGVATAANIVGSGLSTGGEGSRIYNNLIYGFRDINSSSGRCYNFSNSWNDLGVYVYNNTAYNCHTGFTDSSGLAVSFKNNIVQNSVNGFYESVMHSSSDYNISDLAADAPGANSKNSVTVQFADSANKDFHLLPGGIVAKNAGTDLSVDPYFSFVADIDGQPRPNGGIWDIGADEAANAVYYSVGQSTADLKTGSPTVTIASGTATFSVAQIGNIGVGDRVTYNSSSSVAYISGKASTTVWYLVTATGTMPADITNSTVDSIKREYTSMSAAISGVVDASHMNTSDLTAANLQLNLPAYYDSGADAAEVDIIGFTTGAPNYIRLYAPENAVTEVNSRQRHGGKWNNSSYRTLGSSYGNFYTIQADHTVIDGLQIERDTDNMPDGIVVYANNVILRNNIIKSTQLITNIGRGIELGYDYTNAKVYNNIIYGYKKLSGSNSSSIYVPTNKHYIYNNTIVNCDIGVYGQYAENSILKNNITQGCAEGFANYTTHTFSSASDNNISDVAGDAPNATYSTSSIDVRFVDEANADYHLAASSSARNAGANLGTDANFTFSADIDGQARGNGLGWDIGADEAPAPVYYSVGQDTNDHKTGAPTVTVSSTTGLATFSEAQTAANMGVGDVITYGAASSKCYISEKISTSVWRCVTATGTSPFATSSAAVASIAHAYASLSAAEAGATDASHLNASDLVTGNYQLNFPAYHDTGHDLSRVTVSGYTASALNYIKIYAPNSVSSEANSSQRHAGIWDDSKFALSYGATRWDSVLYIGVPYTVVDGLQIEHVATQTDARVGYSANAEGVKISNSIVRLPSRNGSPAEYGVNSGGYSIDIYNNIVYGWGGGIRSANNIQPGATINVYNNTVYGIADVGFGQWGYPASVAYVNLKNNLSSAGSDDFAFDLGGNVTQQYQNNLSFDLTSPNAGATDCGGHGCRNQVVRFINASSSDFRLSPFDSAARNSAANLSVDALLPFNIDIAGNARNFGGAWDIGAFEDGDTAFYGTTRVRQGKMIIDGKMRIE